MNQKVRFEDERDQRFSISEPISNDPTLVVCPKCSGMAKILMSEKQPESGSTVKLICGSCGFNKKIETKSRSFDWHSEDPTDGFFGYALWLKTPCCGHSLWAFNMRHLDLLEAYVSAELRERKRDAYGYTNSSVASRLPKWIKSAKNRDKLLSAIVKLRDTVRGTVS